MDALARGERHQHVVGEVYVFFDGQLSWKHNSSPGPGWKIRLRQD